RFLRHRPDDPDSPDVRVRDRPLPDAQHPPGRPADLPLRRDDGDPVRLLHRGDRDRQRPLRREALGLAALQLRVLPRRRPPLRAAPAAAPAPAGQALLPGEVRLQAALLEMSEAITGELDLGKITDYLTASVTGTMRLEKASVWLRNREGFLE